MMVDECDVLCDDNPIQSIDGTGKLGAGGGEGGG